MSYQALEIPPGQYRNGTDLQSAGRWRDINLVRWHDGAMQPVGGWDQRGDLESGIYRGAIAWTDNENERWIAAGSADSLKVMAGGVIDYDVTPEGLTAGRVDAFQNLGYGGGPYGFGTYGTPRADTGQYKPATTWSLSAWGENLLACSDEDGTIYQWSLDTGAKAEPLTNAPIDNLGVFVTEQRFVFALGADGDPKQIRWSDREDAETWAPAATNEAGDFRLETDGRVMCAARVSGQALILTDREAYSSEYIGPPYVYAFHKVGSACGAVSRNAVCAVSSGAVWMGRRGFFTYSGGAVEALEGDVDDYVFSDLNVGQSSKVYAVSNEMFSEVWWFYPSGDSVECNSYVCYDYRAGHWTTGKMDRTCGVDRGAFVRPIFMEPGGVVYTHENGSIDATQNDVFAESGPIVMGPGGAVVTATAIIPDEKTQGDVTMTVKARMHPNDTETEVGPMASENPTDVRLTGRQLRLRVDGVQSTSWRWGVPRLMVAQRGRR